MTFAEPINTAALATRANPIPEIPPAVRRIEEQRKRVVRPLMLFWAGSYVVGLIILAYFTSLVALKISGSINVAYALALAQFAVTFAVAYIYAREAERLIDPLVADTLSEMNKASKLGVVS